MKKKDVLKVSRIVFDYVLKLDESLIKELLSGSKKLSLVEKNKKDNMCAENYNLEEICTNLNSCLSREEARNYIINEKLNIKTLRELAKVSNIYLRSKCNKDEIIDKIIEGTIGAKLKIKILKGEYNMLEGQQ